MSLMACAAVPPPWQRPEACRDFCAGRRAESLPATRTRNVILVAIDGARWQDVFAGVDPVFAEPGALPRDARALLPRIYARMVDRGVGLGARGAAMAASGPEFASLPGYQELLSGRLATGCESNHCRSIDTPTLLDRVRHGFGLRNDEVAAVASWERMERATSTDNRAIVCSAGRSHGVTRDGLRVSACASRVLDEASHAGPAPGHADYRADRYTMTLALEYLVARRPRALFIGLGDTDEYGHAGDYARYLEALGELDRFIGDLFGTLDRMGEYGRETTVVLTTDHGRAADFGGHGAEAPESARVFLFAAGGAVPARGLVVAHKEYRLADVTPTLLALLGLRPVEGGGAGRPIRELMP